MKDSRVIRIERVISTVKEQLLVPLEQQALMEVNLTLLPLDSTYLKEQEPKKTQVLEQAKLLHLVLLNILEMVKETLALINQILQPFH